MNSTMASLNNQWEKLRQYLHYVSGDMSEFENLCSKHIVFLYCAIFLRGVGQIVFLNNPITGLFLLISLAVYNWLAALSMLLGV